MAKNLGLMAKIGGGCLATLVSLVEIDAAQALDFNFSWDSTSGSSITSVDTASGNPTGSTFPGTGVGTATGSFTVNKNAGESFVAGDMSNISIDIFDGVNTFSNNSGSSNPFTNFTAGTISGDGSSIAFSDFALSWNDGSAKGFACNNIACSVQVVEVGN